MTQSRHASTFPGLDLRPFEVAADYPRLAATGALQLYERLGFSLGRTGILYRKKL